ncbi:hypothetical protein GCM10010174_25830 [Kutzneria viridogrisea]
MLVLRVQQAGHERLIPGGEVVEAEGPGHHRPPSAVSALYRSRAVVGVVGVKSGMVTSVVE